MIKFKSTVYAVLVVLLSACSNEEAVSKLEKPVLEWSQFAHYVDTFNLHDDELYSQAIPNSEAKLFLESNIPYFNCPNGEFEKTYYFRWWTFRKHLKQTPTGTVITEFLPNVSWAGKYNTINCPAGHHFYEGRWLQHEKYLEDYAYFWFRGGGSPQQYSFWAANSILAFAKVHGNRDFIIDLLPDLCDNYQEWTNERGCDDGLYWQIDNSDGMEMSIGGSGKRPTINSYMFGDAKAIEEIASLAGNDSLANDFQRKADRLKQLVIEKLWDEQDTFFKNLPRESEQLVDVRELYGYTPWYFNLPTTAQSGAWKYLLSEQGFKAPFGPTSAEQSHPEFNISYEGHECQWNGPSWPFATTQTLKAMANLLRNYEQSVVSRTDYFDLLETYMQSHRRVNDDGQKVWWIDENLNPYNGDWISRTRLKTWENGSWSEHKGGVERGKDYNHSGFCDLLIGDLIGVIPSMSDELIIDPSIPELKWDWFSLDHLKYHNRQVTIVWDENGTHYGVGKGLLVYIDGELRAHSDKLTKIVVSLK